MAAELFANRLKTDGDTGIYAIFFGIPVDNNLVVIYSVTIGHYRFPGDL